MEGEAGSNTACGQSSSTYTAYHLISQPYKCSHLTMKAVDHVQPIVCASTAGSNSNGGLYYCNNAGHDKGEPLTHTHTLVESLSEFDRLRSRVIHQRTHPPPYAPSACPSKCTDLPSARQPAVTRTARLKEVVRVGSAVRACRASP